MIKIEGQSDFNTNNKHFSLNNGDAAELIEESINIHTITDIHLLVIELPI